MSSSPKAQDGQFPVAGERRGSIQSMSWLESSPRFMDDPSVFSHPLSSQPASGPRGEGSIRRRQSISSAITSDDSLPLRRSTVVGGVGGRKSVSSTNSLEKLSGNMLTSTNSTPERGNSYERLLACLRCFVSSHAFTTSMFVLSFYVLFGDDLRLAFFSKEDDDYFNGVTIFAIVCFATELVLASVALDDYFLSFFFFLDIISTVSLVLDITYVWEAVMGYESITSPEDQDGAQAADQSNYARAGRSSRVGTRVARVLRVFRLIRMARVFKIYSLHKSRRDRKRRGSALLNLAPGEVLEDAFAGGGGSLQAGASNEESRVGKKLSDRTTLWVIILVLAMLVVVPLLDPGTETEMMYSSGQYGADTIYRAWHDYVLAAKSLAAADADPSAAPALQQALQQRRLNWEAEVLLYVYYHNYYAECPDVDGDKGDCASDFFFKLCFLGYVGGDPELAGLRRGYIREMDPETTDWDKLFQGGGADWTRMSYIVGLLPQNIKELLARPWNTSVCPVDDITVEGVSLLRGEQCPWDILRPQEMLRFMPLMARTDGERQEELLLMFDISSQSRTGAVMSMLQTVFIIITLIIGALLFSTDADNLVLHPIERMISKVDIIRRNPLYAIKLGDEQYREQFAEETIRNRSISGSVRQTIARTWRLAVGRNPDPIEVSKKRRPRSKQSAKKTTTLETKILENMIIKLGSLLALGFGEAGSEIIGQNLDDDNVMVDAMIPGRKVEAIYGYCQIQDFTVTTEVLQKRTMVFVNQVAEIVHRICDEHLGAPNKNVGEAFLLVWRVGLYEAELRPKIADLSVMSFIQMIAAINRDRDLAEYREHPALIAKRSDYRVSVNFGLHLGWSIEGAIGSEFKIDASYLSSHVNMAMRLETVTKQYGVMILMSEALVRACTVRLAYHFRAIDFVKLRGAKAPTRLFTVDLDCCALPVEADQPRARRDGNRYRERQRREDSKLQRLDTAYSVHELFATDRNIRRMRSAYPLGFFQEFERGYLNYEAGEWDVAVQVFSRTSGMLRQQPGDPGGAALGLGDGPSRALLEYMCSFNYIAPPSWPGYRELSDTSRFAAEDQAEDHISCL